MAWLFRRKKKDPEQELGKQTINELDIARERASRRSDMHRDDAKRYVRRPEETAETGQKAAYHLKMSKLYDALAVRTQAAIAVLEPLLDPDTIIDGPLTPERVQEYMADRQKAIHKDGTLAEVVNSMLLEGVANGMALEEAETLRALASVIHPDAQTSKVVVRSL
jgi:hypothetical protein